MNIWREGYIYIYIYIYVSWKSASVSKECVITFGIWHDGMLEQLDKAGIRMKLIYVRYGCVSQVTTKIT
jgi:hypothetical protein